MYPAPPVTSVRAIHPLLRGLSPVNRSVRLRAALPRPTADDDLRTYWERRLDEHIEEEAVGHAGLGAGLNGWMMRVRDRVFLREVGPLVASLPSRSVLDVGSGTGVNIDRWQQLGAVEIVGSDIAQVAVERLRTRYPEATFVRYTIGSELPEELRERRFGAISAMEVLFHVLDDEGYQRAFTDLYELLEPGGLLVFSENLLHGDELRSSHQRSRRLETVERVVRDTGFTLIRRRPLFFLLNAPHDSTSRLHRAWWRAVAALASRSDRAGAGLGALLFRPELAITRRLQRGSVDGARALPAARLTLARRAL